LGDVANEMNQEDGLICVYGASEEEFMEFTDFAIETLRNSCRLLFFGKNRFR
jgi:hypothetical protein